MGLIGSILGILGILALGVLIVFIFDMVDLGIEKLVRRFKPQRTHQHYPGGPYLQTPTMDPYGF